MILSAAQSQLLIVDVQEKLLSVIPSSAGLVEATARLIRAARRLRVPVTISEQNPASIGPTAVAVLEAAAGDAAVVPKMAFGCACDSKLAQLIAAHRLAGRRQIVMAGIEAHVCVLQSALGFAQTGYSVAVVADVVASRAALSREIALRRMEQSGIALVTLEMVVFEWLERAGTADFRALLPLIK